MEKLFTSFIIYVLLCFNLIAEDAKKEISHYDLGPVLEFLKITEEASSKIFFRSIGPILEYSAPTSSSFMFAIRPLFSIEKNNKSTATDFLWPLHFSRLRENKERFTFSFFNVTYYEEDGNTDKKYHKWNMPFFFRGRAQNNKMYYAFFPFWGTIRDFIGFDWVKFHLFPLHVATKKLDQKSHSWLWPFFSTTTGNKINKLRIFPLYSNFTKKESHTTSSILWPFIHYGHSLSSIPGKWFFFFPLYGEMISGDTKKTSFLWPFFSYKKSPQGSKLNAPWPFITISHSNIKGVKMEEKTFWPFYEYNKNGKITKRTILWPFWIYRKDEGKSITTERTWTLLFNMYQKNTQKGKIIEERRKFWPFFTYHKQGENSYFSLLSLWPYVETEAIRRNFAPLWEIFKNVKSKNSIKKELFWGLAKYQKNLKQTKHSLFPLYSFSSKKNKSTSIDFLTGILGFEKKYSGKNIFKIFWFIKF